jgi:hypothetical protein
MKKKSLLLVLTLSVAVWLAIAGGPGWGQGTPSPANEEFITGPDLEAPISLGDGISWESVLKVTKSFAAGRDNTIFEFTPLSGDLSEGGGSWIFTGRTNQPADQGPVRRGLIFFDLADSGIPPNALVTKVTLQLHLSASAPRSGPQSTSLHRLLTDWGEGNSFSQGTGGVPTPGDATWRHTFFNTSFWTTPGGDFSPTTSATTLVDKTGFYSWSSFQMALDVQDWLTEPATNFGWIILGNETLPQSAKRFDSRQNTTAADRPLLIVEYQPALKNYFLPIIMKQ